MSRPAVLPLLVQLALLATLACAAPVPEKEVDKRRESTKETIELENTLKRLAGEDKKYFSNTILQPMPQIDGLEDRDGSGEAPPPQQELEQPEPQQTEPQPEQQPEPQPELRPLEEQLKEIKVSNEALAEQLAKQKMPMTGPYGPGLESDGGPSLEYEPSYEGGEDEAEDEEDETLQEREFLKQVVETLQRRPELLYEIIQEGNELEEPEEAQRPSEMQSEPVSDSSDYEDRMNMIRAELAAIRAEDAGDYSGKENRQVYQGDRQAHVVAKKQSLPAIPKEHVQDDIDSYNQYFDKYDRADGAANQLADVPIM